MEHRGVKSDDGPRLNHVFTGSTLKAVKLMGDYLRVMTVLDVLAGDALIGLSQVRGTLIKAL